jgi:hypothetical protein
VGLRCKHLPASHVIHDFEHLTMSVNKAIGASGIGLVLSYISISLLNLLYLV